ncbi:hypothetical protein [Phyllobacterium sp. SB3]|uniref:hypothetical protein n=1 Tax=Phyllobacterium sp. SB3 TaxID=3156073 RepID=UPI0032AEEA9C
MNLTLANDNEEFEVPVTVPPEKQALREWLAPQMVGAKITKIPTRPQPEPKAWKPKRLEVANDNKESVPLCEALIRDKRHDDATLVRRYRLLVEVAGLPGMDDNVDVGRDGVEIARRTSFPDGGAGEELKDHGQRITARPMLSYGTKVKVTSSDIPASSKAPVNLSGSEDALIAHIDAKAVLGPLRAAMGPLLETFEDAALDCLTLTEIGEARGFKGKQASAAAKALIYAAIEALSHAWTCDKRRARGAAEYAEIVTARARRDIEAGRILYFGKDVTAKPCVIYGRSKAA